LYYSSRGDQALMERLAVCHRLILFLSEERENYNQQVRSGDIFTLYHG
jgi:hypothetical protein